MKFKDAIHALKEEQLKANHRSTTRDCYRGWVSDYLGMLRSREVDGMQDYLSKLALEPRRLSWKSRKQALNALVFFHRKVLKTEVPPNSLDIGIPTKGKRAPVFLTHPECMAVLSRLERINRLQSVLMYGCGLRVTECLTMRLKDIDLASGMLTVRSGKGDKDRMVRLPRSFYPMIEDQIRRCRSQFQRDSLAGLVFPIDNPSLMRKLGRAQFKRLPWYPLFPSRVTRGDERWHATTKGLVEPLRRAAEDAGILKRVTPHIWRHSYATNLLTSGTDIRTIQDQLGHTNVETTMIYTHAVGFHGTESPLDKLGSGSPDNSVLQFHKSA